MKIFAIRDESAEVQKDLAYLLYYELENFTEIGYTKEEILKLLKKYQKERKLTIIMITHNLENTLYSDRIVVLNQGKIYIDGSLEQVYEQKEKLSKLKLNLPFIINLSYKLKEENVINKIYTEPKKLLEDLWP